MAAATGPVTSTSQTTVATASAPTPSRVIQDAVTQMEARAAAMPDEIFYGWDASYASRAELQDLRRQASCGGGGCNDYFCNWQLWAVLGGIPCNVTTFTNIMFQMERYMAAQARLRSLLANMPDSTPKTWWDSQYGASRPAPEGVDISQAVRPTFPYYGAIFSARATQWADWCMDVLRTVAVAQWATNVRWSNPLLYSGGTVELRYIRAAGGVPLDPNNPSLGYRPLTEGEMPLAGTIGSQPAPQGGGIAIDSGGWAVDSNGWQGFGQYGYVRGTSPRGVFAPGAWQLQIPQYAANMAQDDPLRALMIGGGGGHVSVNPRPYVYLSDALGLRWVTDSRSTPRGDWSGHYPPRVPITKSDFDPQSFSHSMPAWPSFFEYPADSTPRGILTALFSGRRGTGRTNITLNEAAQRRWDLRLAGPVNGDYAAYAGPLRHVILCLQLAFDIVERPWGHAISDAFNSYLMAVSQLPLGMRTLTPDQMLGVNRAMTQNALNSFAAILETSGGITTALATAIVSPIAGAVIAAVYAILSGLIREALNLGIVRTTNPACLPAPVIRALPEPAEGNACWLVPDQVGNRGGASSITQRSQAIATTVRDADTEEEMANVYAATEAAAHTEIGAHQALPDVGGATTQTQATTGKKVAAAVGGVGAGLILARVLIGG